MYYCLLSCGSVRQAIRELSVVRAFAERTGLRVRRIELESSYPANDAQPTRLDEFDAHNQTNCHGRRCAAYGGWNWLGVSGRQRSFCWRIIPTGLPGRRSKAAGRDLIPGAFRQEDLGVGKSVLLKRFLHELSGPMWQPMYLHLTHLSAAGLLKLLVGKLGEVPRLGKHRLFEQILEKAHQAEGALLVILDEAHLLEADAHTDIRLLISSALDDAPPWKVVLAGQNPLRRCVNRHRPRS